MKVILLVAALAVAHGAKLERAYLPPSYARTSGGSGNILETPFAGPKNTEAIFNPNFAQSVNAQTDNKFAQQASQISNDNARFGGNSFRGDNARFGDNAQFERQYAQSGNGFAQTQYDARPERAQAALERNAAILRNDNSNDGETFSYAFETENGIYAEESGVATNGVEAQGGYSYTGDDGRVYSVRYTADQNGFVPQGDHLPTPPPIPEEILKALEQNARDEAAGIYDDGSYNEAKYTESQSQYNQNQYAQPATNLNYDGDDDTVVTNSALPSSRNSPLGQSNLGSPASPQNAYLPPLAQRNSFGRRQSFDRNGYRY